MNRYARYALVSFGVLISALSFQSVFAQETAAIDANKEQDDGDDDNWTGSSRLEITVINLTRGQQFTPILVATHKRGVRLFEAGQPASPQLATLAEEGDTGPLSALLNGIRTWDRSSPDQALPIRGNLRPS